MYKHDSKLSENVCRTVNFDFSIHPLKTMQRNGKTYVKGTALKPDESKELEYQCEKNGLIYKGPFV